MDKIVIVNNALTFSDEEAKTDAYKKNHYAFRDIPELSQYWKEHYHVVQIIPIIPSAGGTANLFTTSIVVHLRNNK